MIITNREREIEVPEKRDNTVIFAREDGRKATKNTRD
jgi:hypothetical protein